MRICFSNRIDWDVWKLPCSKDSDCPRREDLCRHYSILRLVSSCVPLKLSQCRVKQKCGSDIDCEIGRPRPLYFHKSCRDFEEGQYCDCFEELENDKHGSKKMYFGTAVENK